MTLSSELLALQQILENCRLHETGLRDALDDLALRALCGADLPTLGKEDRRLLDSPNIVATMSHGRRACIFVPDVK